MKKKILLAIAVVLFVLTLIIGSFHDRRQGHGLYVADQKKYAKIKEKYSTTDQAFSLCFDGEKLPYDAESRTFYLPLDMEDADWESGKWSGFFVRNVSEQNDSEQNNSEQNDSAKSDLVQNEQPDKNRKNKQTENAELFFLENYMECDKKQMIASGEAVDFLALSKDGYAEYHLVFTGLPMITFTGTGELADDQTQIFLLKVYDTDHSGDWVTTCYTKARPRGNTSLAYEKKSLRLYLKDKNEDGVYEKTDKNLLGLRKDDDWILNSLYADNTRIRDQLCIDLWQEVGANNNPYGYSYGTQSAMVEVMINDGYQGLYDLMVPIDAKQLGLNKVSQQLAEKEAVIERIYKKKYSRDWMSSDFVGALPDANSPDYRGGFYLKGDTILQTEEEWAPLFRLASDLEADDTTFIADITKYNDKQNLIDNWLFYQAIAGFDNQNKNYYYVVRDRGGQDYGYFVPWDLNISFGMVYADNEYYSEDLLSVATEPVIWQPAQRMIELDADGAKADLKKTWKKWRKGAFSDEAITERIKDLEHRVKDSGAFAREAARYPNGNQREDFSYIYDFAIQRLSYVDGYVDELCR